jgi:hypothetical protein
METEIINHRSGLKITFIILIIIVAAFLIYYSVMSVLGPVKKMEALINEFGANTTQNRIDKAIISDSTYLSLLREKSFLQSRVVMAETDSIYLTISIPDSTVNVEISGVTVHTSKINDFKISSILEGGNKEIILSMFGAPLSIVNDYSTIRKEPVLIKMAPKDTSEYIPDVMPDTSITEPVNYILEMTDGIRIYVHQSEAEDFNGKLNLFWFDTRYLLHDTWREFKNIVAFKVPEYHPFIKIHLPRADAKIIYRALPKNGQIAFFR